MENDEEEKDKSLKNLEEAMKEIDKMSTIDKYKWLFASYANNRDYKKEMKKEKRKEKKKSDSLIRRIMNKFNTSKDDEDVIIEESNDKPKKDE